MVSDALKPFVHPYIPNSVPEVKREMLADIGLADVAEILKELSLIHI